jgi:hypothetical protein
MGTEYLLHPTALTLTEAGGLFDLDHEFDELEADLDPDDLAEIAVHLLYVADMHGSDLAKQVCSDKVDIVELRNKLRQSDYD